MRNIDLRKIAAMFLIISGILFGFMLYWMNSLVKEFVSVKLSRVYGPEKQIKQVYLQENTFEEGGIVNESELASYYLFSKETDLFDVWKKSLVGQGLLQNFESSRKQLVFKKDVPIAKLLMNHCGELYCYQHRISFDEIPSLFWKGLIGTEDARYLRHFGVDFKSIARAIIRDIWELKLVQGGSTLTQQLVKNLFLSSEKTFGRKIKEIIISLYVEYILEKDDILEIYLNEAYWGSLQGVQIRGVMAASLFYFGKKPNFLESYEVAILIGLLKGPAFYNPLVHLNRLYDRTEVVYKRLAEIKLFSNSLDRIWGKKDWEDWQKSLMLRQKIKPYRPFFDTNRWQFSPLSEYENYIFYRKSDFLLSRLRERYENADVAIKAIIAPPMKQDLIFEYYSKVERKIHAGLYDERHQIGSTLKPIIYASLLKHGVTLDEEVQTAPIVLNLASGTWSPAEAHKISVEKISVSEALMKSFNNPLIRLVQKVGFDLVEEDLKYVLPNLKTPLKEYPAQLLGAIELSIDEVYKMYAGFLSRECFEIIQREAQSENSVFFTLSDPEQTTVSGSLNRQMRGMRFFGKTGTSNKGMDNWFVFYDGLSLGVIWVGLEGSRLDKSLNLYGSTTAYRIFQDFYLERGKRFNELTCDKFMREK